MSIKGKYGKITTLIWVPSYLESCILELPVPNELDFESMTYTLTSL